MDANKRIFGIILSTIVALVGVETVTEEPIVSNSLNNATSWIVDLKDDLTRIEKEV